MCCTYSVLVRPLVPPVLQNNTYYSPLIYQAGDQKRTGQGTKLPILSGSKHPLERLLLCSMCITSARKLSQLITYTFLKRALLLTPITMRPALQATTFYSKQYALGFPPIVSLSLSFPSQYILFFMYCPPNCPP